MVGSYQHNTRAYVFVQNSHLGSHLTLHLLILNVSLKSLIFNPKLYRSMPNLKTYFYIKRNWEIFEALSPSVRDQFYLSPDWQVSLRMIVCIWVSPLAPRRDNRWLSPHSKHKMNGFKESSFMDSTSNVWIPWGQSLKVEASWGAALWGSWAKQAAWARKILLPWTRSMFSEHALSALGFAHLPLLLVYSYIPRICNRLCP